MSASSASAAHHSEAHINGALHPWGIHLPGILKANARCGFTLPDLVQELSHNSVGWGRHEGANIHVHLRVISFAQLRPFLREAIDDNDRFRRIEETTPPSALFLVHADDGIGMSLHYLKLSNLQGLGNAAKMKPSPFHWWPCALNPDEDDEGQSLRTYRRSIGLYGYGKVVAHQTFFSKANPDGFAGRDSKRLVELHGHRYSYEFSLAENDPGDEHKKTRLWSYGVHTHIPVRRNAGDCERGAVLRGGSVEQDFLRLLGFSDSFNHGHINVLPLHPDTAPTFLDNLFFNKDEWGCWDLFPYLKSGVVELHVQRYLEQPLVDVRTSAQWELIADNMELGRDITKNTVHTFVHREYLPEQTVASSELRNVMLGVTTPTTSSSSSSSSSSSIAIGVRADTESADLVAWWGTSAQRKHTLVRVQGSTSLYGVVLRRGTTAGTHVVRLICETTVFALKDGDTLHFRWDKTASGFSRPRGGWERRVDDNNVVAKITMGTVQNHGGQIMTKGSGRFTGWVADCEGLWLNHPDDDLMSLSRTRNAKGANRKTNRRFCIQASKQFFDRHMQALHINKGGSFKPSKQSVGFQLLRLASKRWHKRRDEHSSTASSSSSSSSSRKRGRPSSEDDEDEDVKKKQRRGFSRKICHEALLACDGKDPVLGIRLETFGYDFDHKDGHRDNNHATNCQPLSIIMHRMKTMDEARYSELVENHTSRLAFLEAMRDSVDEAITALKQQGTPVAATRTNSRSKRKKANTNSDELRFY